jgi:hypothetical protein
MGLEGKVYRVSWGQSPEDRMDDTGRLSTGQWSVNVRLLRLQHLARDLILREDNNGGRNIRIADSTDLASHLCGSNTLLADFNIMSCQQRAGLVKLLHVLHTPYNSPMPERLDPLRSSKACRLQQRLAED